MVTAARAWGIDELVGAINTETPTSTGDCVVKRLLADRELGMAQTGFASFLFCRLSPFLAAYIDGDAAGPAEEGVMKADAVIRFILSGNRSLEEFAVLLARISLGVFFAISGGNKLFGASQHKLMYETIVGAGIRFPHVMTYFVSSVEFVCGCLLIMGLLSTLCCMAFMIDMIVAITTVQLATLTKALSFIDRLDDFLYLPEVMYIIIFLWLISSGPGRLSVDHWIAVRSGLLNRGRPRLPML
jgi:putative oxidoreductase